MNTVRYLLQNGFNFITAVVTKTQLVKHSTVKEMDKTAIESALEIVPL